MKNVPLKYMSVISLGKMLQSTPARADQEVFPYLKASNLTENGLDLSSLQQMPFNRREQEILQLQKDDVVVVEGGSIGRSAWISEDMAGVYFQNSINRVRPKIFADGRYLKYAIESRRASGFFEAITNQATIRHLTADKLANTPVPYLNQERQRKIADYLDHETTEIDAFIAAHEQLQELTSLRLETTIEAAITLSSPDFLQLRRLKPLRQSGTSVNAESRPAFSGELGVLKTGAASKGYFDPAENKAVTEDQEVARLSTPVVKDRVLVNRANTPDLVGTAVYVPEDYPELYLSDKLWIVDFDASNQFLALALSTRSYREQVSQFVVGASSSMQNLSYGDFLSIRVPVPSVEQQNQVVVALQSSIRATRALGTEITTAIHLARERRAALITAAVTGQIDVTARNKPAAEQLEDDIAQGLHREYA